MRQLVAAMYVNLRSYTSYISGNRVKTLEIRLLRRFGGFSVLCKGFSSGALLHIWQKDKRTGNHFISDRRTKGHDTHPQPPFFDKRSDFVDYPSEARPLELCSLAWARTRSLSSTSEATSSITPREGSVDGWGKYGLRSSLLAFNSQTTSPKMGKRITMFTLPLRHSAVVGCYSFAPSGAYPCCILSPRALPGAGISMPLRGVNLTFAKKQAKKVVLRNYL